jgi:hypothetical protein
MNEKHLEYQIDFFKEKNKNKTVSVELDYITYKKESVSIEESQQLKFAIGLKESGYKVKIKDQRPEVIEQIQGLI